MLKRHDAVASTVDQLRLELDEKDRMIARMSAATQDDKARIARLERSAREAWAFSRAVLRIDARVR